jgi:hypothetical protein
MVASLFYGASYLSYLYWDFPFSALVQPRSLGAPWDGTLHASEYSPIALGSFKPNGVPKDFALLVVFHSICVVDWLISLG